MAHIPAIVYLSRSDIIHLGGSTSHLYVEAIRHGLALHAQADFAQPLKPYLRWRGAEGHIADRIIAMPAYIGGTAPIAGLKWIGSKHDNPLQRGIARASALIILNDAETHYPIAILEGGLISSMRTAAVTAVAASYLARPNFQTISCIGCGPIGRTQIITLLEQFPSIEQLFLYDIRHDAAQTLAEELGQYAPQNQIHVMSSPRAAVEAGAVVMTCTTTGTAYIPFEWIQKGCFISNVSLMDFFKDVYTQVDKVVVDDWTQSNREKKVIHHLVLEGRFSREQLHAELGEIVIGRRPGRESPDEIILLNPMGMAIEDIACAVALYERAVALGVGTTLSLYG